MPSRILAALLVSAAASAHAQADGIPATQLFDGTQTGTNSLFLNTSPSGPLTVGGPGLARGADQSVLNAANVLIGDGVLSSSRQRFVGTQAARNAMTGTGTSPTLAVVQSGDNLANVVSAERVDSVSQSFGPGATQEVVNLFAGASAEGGLTQTGRNTANVVSAVVSIGEGQQLFPEGSVQRIANHAAVGGASGAVVQEGINIGNVLTAERVENVTRVFDGAQVVTNTFDASGALPPSLRQSGLNVANFVSAQTVHGLTQRSEGTQVVENVVVGATLAELEAAGTTYTHESTNIVNLLDIRAASGGEDGVGIVTAAQEAYQAQQAAGSGDGASSQVGNATSVER